MRPLPVEISADGVVTLSVPSSDGSKVYHPHVAITGRMEVWCDCPHWDIKIAPTLNSLSMTATARDGQWHCSHIRRSIEELRDSGVIA